MAKVIPLSDLPVFQSGSTETIAKEDFQKGAVILMDKPQNWTSFDLVKYVRNRVPAKKVGHAGTLDPLATGLLVICTGKATKSISQIQELEKTYVAGIRFGASTASYDAAMEPDETAEWNHITEKEIKSALTAKFTGVIQQVPPKYSALLVGGKRMYDLARKGLDLQPEARPVEIHEIDVLSVNLPDITITVRCGKGTYIRSLAHDLGIALNSRAHLADLRRTKTGIFHVNKAFTPENFNSIMTNRS